MRPFSFKTFRSYAYLWFAVFGYFDAVAQNQKIVDIAQKDVGTLEKTRKNDHPLFDFYRATVAKDLNNWKAPYCGCAVYAWYLQAGLKPLNTSPAVALFWKREKGVKLGATTTAESVKKLMPGMVVLMKFSRYHVGVLKQAYPAYVVTIEGNTSNANSVNRVAVKADGVMEKIRPYYLLIAAYDWYSDAEKIDATKYIKIRNQYLKQ
jgi:hypothetical protein